MMNKLLILLLGTSLLAGAPALGTTAQDSWKWQREIKTDEASRFNRFDISPEIYAKAQLALGDLRIVDDSGAAVPYILDGNREITMDSQDAYPFSLVKNFRKNNDTSFDFVGQAPEGTDLILNRLTAQLSTVGDFFKYIEVYGSYDGTHWDWIANDSFYSVEGSLDSGLSFDSPQKYTSYRIVVLDNVEGISLTGLSGSLSSASERLSTRKVIFNSNQYSRTESGTTTVIRLKGFRNLPVRTLSMDADGLFHRPCRIMSGEDPAIAEMFGSGYLYQSTLRGTEPLRNSLSVQISHSYDTLVLMIENGDNPPLKIQSITMEYAADGLVFEPAKDSKYYLQYGNSSALKPDYDLEQFRNEISQQTMGTAVLLGEVQLEAPSAPGSSSMVNQKSIFSGVIFVVALLLGWLAIRGMKKVKD